MNGLLVSSEYVGKDDVRKKELLSQGHVTDGRFMYFVRPGMHRFLELLFGVFDVGLWTCAKKRKATDTMNAIFTQEERSKFKFLYNQSHAKYTGIMNPYKTSGESPVYVKPLSLLYGSPNTPFNESNTLLIDDSPYKAILNPPNTSLFAPTFSIENVKDDDFLLCLLWPVLEKLQYARDVRIFLSHNEPWWSRNLALLDRKNFPKIYEGIVLSCKEDIRRIPQRNLKPFSVLDVSPFELPWAVVDLVNSIGSPVSSLNDEVVADLVFDLGSGCGGVPVPDPRKFLEDVFRIRDTTLHFKYRMPFPDSCLADRSLDPMGLKGTCTNRACGRCGPVPLVI